MSGFIVTTTAVALIIWATIRVTDWVESNNDRIDQMVHDALEDDPGTPIADALHFEYWEKEWSK